MPGLAHIEKLTTTTITTEECLAGSSDKIAK